VRTARRQQQVAKDHLAGVATNRDDLKQFGSDTNGGWQRLCLLGGTGDRAEQAQSAGSRAPGTHAGSLEKYQPALKKQMQAALQKVAAAKGLSKDVWEVLVRALG
jgi:hypothetical protein